MTCNLENTSSREMFREDTDKDILTFHDIAACFSEEEWKLLNEWQEELYNNVMKEIEQTLISLGPRIASSVFSLRVKAKTDMYYVDNSQSVRRSRAKPCQSEMISNPDASFTVNPEGTQYITDAPDADSGQSDDCLCTAGSMISSAVSTEENTQQKWHVKNEPEPRETSTEQGIVTPVDALLNKEETDAFCFDRHDPEGVGNSRCTKEHVIITQIDEFQIKEETDRYCLDHPESEGRGSNSFTSGDPSMNRKKKGGHCITYSEESSLCKSSSGKNNTVVLQSSNKEANSRGYEWTKSSQIITGEKSDQNDSDFSSPVHLNLHHDDDYENNLRILQFSGAVPNTQRRDTYSSVNKINSLKRKCTKLMRTNSRARPYACPECEKTFVWKSHFIMHHRIHSGEKPFMCTFCPKKFNRQSTLDQHIRLHTGERPYKCTTCKMSFIRNCDLRYHCKKEQHVI
ncbi:zinc finger protein 701-like isoform X1 [Pleurodeles waltl]|uniref:zinc finger protein 701-like isoform X1 n=1 Tax=Pleurodeles waltl TaxID=8319 RepID=UPI00370946F7